MAVNGSALQHHALCGDARVTARGKPLGAGAALSGSALAAKDLAAVRPALGITGVDPYVDACGIFFAQAFAGRPPARLRSVALDAAGAARAAIVAGPWCPSAAPPARAAFHRAGARSVACAVQPSPSMGRSATLLNTRQAAPVTGTAADGEGNPQAAPADAKGLTRKAWPA